MTILITNKYRCLSQEAVDELFHDLQRTRSYGFIDIFVETILLENTKWEPHIVLLKAIEPYGLGV